MILEVIDEEEPIRLCVWGLKVPTTSILPSSKDDDPPEGRLFGRRGDGR
jgi:hypothetical protein